MKFNRYIGIKFHNWYRFSILLGNRALWISLFKNRFKRPTYVFWNKEEFKHSLKYNLYPKGLLIGISYQRPYTKESGD